LGIAFNVGRCGRDQLKIAPFQGSVRLVDKTVTFLVKPVLC